MLSVEDYKPTVEAVEYDGDDQAAVGCQRDVDFTIISLSYPILSYLLYY